MIRTGILPRLTFPEAVEDRVFSLGFATWNVMGIPLIARVKPMTVRKMGAVFTEMMATLGRQDLSELRFELLGSAGVSKSDVESSMQEATRAYDRAAAVWHTPIELDNELWPAARPFMIDGGWDLINRGYYREAHLWVMLMYWLAHVALKTDAPEEYEAVFRRPYERFTEAIGLGSNPAIQGKVRLVEQFLTEIISVAKSILDRESQPAPATTRKA